MSLEALIGEDWISVSQQTVTQDASGGPVRTWAVLYSYVPARVLDPSADEQLRFMMLGTVAPHRIIHQCSNIGEGMLVTTSDGRTIKVQGTETKRTMGGIDTYYISHGTEWRPGS